MNDDLFDAARKIDLGETPRHPDGYEVRRLWSTQLMCNKPGVVHCCDSHPGQPCPLAGWVEYLLATNSACELPETD
jgi:hypothetical protein